MQPAPVLFLKLHIAQKPESPHAFRGQKACTMKMERICTIKLKKGQQGFSWLLQSRRKARKADAQKEQLRLLRQILAELQRLNANLAAGNTGRLATIKPNVSSDADSSDYEELEEYE
jgi:hypothetical protein